MSAAALVGSTASFLTSKTTTAKPLPALPARAVSISAFKANRLGPLSDGGDALDQRRQCARFPGHALDAVEVAFELVVLRLQLHIDRGDDLLVVLDQNVRTLIQFFPTAIPS